MYWSRIKGIKLDVINQEHKFAKPLKAYYHGYKSFDGFVSIKFKFHLI